MARFDDRRKVDVGEGKDAGAIYLNEPTVKQLNQYHNDCVVAKGRKVTTKKTTAAVKLFDAVFDEAVKVEVKDETGKWVPLTKDTLKHVPPRRKQNCVDGALLGLDEAIEMGEDDEDEEEGEEEDGGGVKNS